MLLKQSISVNLVYQWSKSKSRVHTPASNDYISSKVECLCNWKCPGEYIADQKGYYYCVNLLHNPIPQVSIHTVNSRWQRSSSIDICHTKRLHLLKLEQEEESLK